MAKCAICDKTQSYGNKISIARSHVSRRSTRAFKPNLRAVTIDVNGESKRLCVCSKCLRNLKKA